VLRSAVEAASVELERDGIATIPTSLGFHGLRRTYASLGCACGEDIAYASSQLGHEDPRFTLKVYAQATKRRKRLSGLHLRAYDRALDGHEWALSRRTSRYRFRSRQQRAPSSGAYEEEERMMGLEPTTFCMASRRSSQLSYIRPAHRV
jgi:hypothetical protein